MRLTTLLAVASLALADTPIDYWYRLCSKDTLKNEAVLEACPKKKSTCLLKSELYQRSLFACYEKAESKSTRPKGLLTYDHSYAYMAKTLKGTPSMSIDELIDLSKSDPITQTYAEANKTKSGAFLPRDQWLTQVNVDGQTEWTYQHIWARLLGQISCYYVFGIVGLQTIFNFLSWVLPSLVRVISNNTVSRIVRRYTVLPALFNKHRSTPYRLFRWFMLCFPPRMHVLLLLGYLTICIVGLAWHYPITLSTAVSKDSVTYISGNLGYRASAMLVYKLPLLFLFAGRNNFMIWLTGWQMEIYNHWHRWIARLVVIDMIIHAIAETVSDVHADDYVGGDVDKGFWRVGVMAGIALSLAAVHSTKTFRAPAYETFLLWHILLAIIFVVGAYYHVKSRVFGIYQMYTVIAIWAFDRAARLVRIVVNGVNNKATIRTLPGGTMEVTVQYNGLMKPQAGAYCFLHFGHPYLWFQSHPLSVVPVEGSPKTLKFISKAQKGITRIMHDRAEAAGGSIETRVWIDGMYGVSFPTKQYKEIVMIAGGIGFTSVYSHTINLLKTNKGQLVHLHWAISNTDPLTSFATEIENLAKYTDLRFTVHLNASSASIDSVEGNKEKDDSSSSASQSYDLQYVQFAPNFDQLVLSHIRGSDGPICFFNCGPPMMADAVRDAVATNLLTSKNYVQFYEESFTM